MSGCAERVGETIEGGVDVGLNFGTIGHFFYVGFNEVGGGGGAEEEDEECDGYCEADDDLKAAWEGGAWISGWHGGWWWWRMMKELSGEGMGWS